MIALKCNLPEGWKLVPLGELCDINPRKPRNFKRAADAPTTFIPMEAVDDKTGAVISPQVRPYGAVARGYTYFEEGNVIFAKITPCMQNGKTAIVSGLLDGIGYGSTEFHVLRAKPGVDVRWVYHLLRTAEFRRKAEENFEGSAGQRRVPDEFLKAVLIPVLKDGIHNPPDVSILGTRIEAIQRLQPVVEAQHEAAYAMSAAELRSVYSQKKLPQGWKYRPISELIKMDGVHIDSNYPDFSTLPFLGLENIESGTGRFVTPEDKTEPGISTCYRYGAQHVLYGKLRPYLNKVFLPEGSGRCALEIIPFLPKAEYSREFVASVLMSPLVVAYATKHSTGGRMPRAEINKLLKYEVPTPASEDGCNQLGAFISSRLISCRAVCAAANCSAVAFSALQAATLREFFNLGNNTHA